jgi:hypothetical protein
MPLQNRVTPLGELVAEPGRGLVYGNRGCLHDARGRICRRYAVRRWIACRLEFRGWHRGPMMQPGRFTELFFLDEATAFAAGHRPCALCRREDYRRFARLWEALHPDQQGADAVDRQLHAERLDRGGGRRLQQVALDGLPDGACVLWGRSPVLVLGDRLWAWDAAGYRDPVGRPRGARATLITPPSLAEVLRAGWESDLPLVHPSARTL